MLARTHVLVCIPPVTVIFQLPAAWARPEASSLSGLGAPKSRVSLRPVLVPAKRGRHLPLALCLYRRQGRFEPGTRPCRNLTKGAHATEADVHPHSRLRRQGPLFSFGAYSEAAPSRSSKFTKRHDPRHCRPYLFDAGARPVSLAGMVEHSREVGSPRARLASGDSGLGTLTFVATTIVATVTATITAGIITAITITAGITAGIITAITITAGITTAVTVTVAAVTATIAAGITTAITIAAGITTAVTATIAAATIVTGITAVTATITAGITAGITAAVTITAGITAGIAAAVTITAGITAAICRITTRVRRFAWIRVGAISGVATARDGRVTWVVTARDGRVTWVAGESSALAATRTAPTAVVRPTSTTVIASAEYAKP
jgi:hypothetical protein